MESAAVWVSIDKLLPWDKNPRKNEKAIPKVVESIKRFGFAAPIIARRDGKIIAGHTRYHAAKQLGLDSVPVRYMDLDPADARLLALADNKLNEIAEWDENALGEILSELNIEDLSITGFDRNELNEILNTELNGNEYSRKIESPIYQVTGEKPSFEQMVNTSKYELLVKEIDQSSIDEESKKFLKLAATRHIVFSFSKIAEWYAHQEIESQNLAEKSALIVIDFNKAIEYGFVKLTKAISDQFSEDYEDE